MPSMTSNFLDQEVMGRHPAMVFFLQQKEFGGNMLAQSASGLLLLSYITNNTLVWTLYPL